MHVISINVGRPRELSSGRRTVRTSIRKVPVSGRVRIRRLNVAGDQQSDLNVHGGIDKAVYAYPSEHYSYWARELDGVALSRGSFGENFTISGLLEDAVHIGDVLRIGSAELTVTQPRIPCFKLGMRFERPDMAKRFLDSHRTGFYLRVSLEGDAEAGDAITIVSRDRAGIAVVDIVRAKFGRDAAGHADQELLRRASALTALPSTWRDEFKKRLQALNV